ncbi:MAG: thioredoxin domain-containing protein [Bacteroidales bacterium]
MLHKLSKTILLLIIFNACNSKEPEVVIAKTNKEDITLYNIDKTINQQLYADLYHIYFIRSIALEQVVFNKLLTYESDKYKINIDTLYRMKILSKINDSLVEKIIKSNGLENNITIPNRNKLIPFNLKSNEAKRYLIQECEEMLKTQYSDSLKKIYNYKNLLAPPERIKTIIESKTGHFRGNLNSKITVFEISDFYCDVCKKSAPVYNAIYEKYKDKVKFCFLNFAPDISFASLACESASMQGKFWQMHDSIFRIKQNVDSLTIIKIASDIGLDIPMFLKDLGSEKNYQAIQNEIAYLFTKGFFATPTIIINGSIVNDPTSYIEINELLEKEIAKLND